MTAVLSASCPACGTLFKLVADQLKVADGWVRCGHCQHAFVAQAHALDRPRPSTPQPGIAAVPHPAPPSVWPEADAIDLDFDLDEDAHRSGAQPGHPPPAMPDWLAALSLDLVDPASSPAPAAFARPAGTAPDTGTPASRRAASHGGADDPAVYGGDIEIPDFLALPSAQQGVPEVLLGNPPPRPGDARTAATPVPVPAHAPSTAGVPAAPGASGRGSALPISMEDDEHAAQPMLKSQARAVVSQATPLHAEAPAAARGHAADTPVAAADAALAAPHAGDAASAGRRPTKRLRRVALAVLAVVLAALLAMQVAARFFPDWLARQPQGLQGAVARVCQTLGGCNVPSTRLPDSVSISAGRLDRSDDGTYLLSFELHNRAPYQQDLPHVELSLLDAANEAVVRRRLAPSDLPGAPARLQAGSSWKAELSLALDPSAVPDTGTGVVGYRLRLFQPGN
ncbi:zinc-ribbon and DUF3426 domain-containing protein [Comamonadaceae bacterium PP-2]